MSQPETVPSGSGIATPSTSGRAAATGSSNTPATAGAIVHRFMHEAMGSMFEVRIIGETAEYARQAADAAFLELDHLHAELNRFSASSDVSQINALKVGRRLRVGIATFECLQAAAETHRETGGAFDVTIGRLYALWQPKAEVPPKPTEVALAEARVLTGMNLIEFYPQDFSVAVKREGVQIDLGAVGKGYAVDRMIDVLKEWSVKTALVHGGQSSVYCLGTPPGKKGWTLSLRGPGESAESYGLVHLTDRSLSGSAVLPKWRHIIDPRTGQVAMGHAGAWAVAKNGTQTDCLSTAFMVMSLKETEEYCKRHPDVGAAVLEHDEAGATEIHKFGKWDE
jgi:FAD:protein FMN transferase